MGQVTSVWETETHDSVLGVDQGSERGEAGQVSYSTNHETRSVDSLGGGSRVWLDVDTPDLGVKVEGLERSVSAEVLEDIDVLKVSVMVIALRHRYMTHLVTTVVSCSGKTLRVLVGQHGSVGLHDGERGQVLRIPSVITFVQEICTDENVPRKR